ncbi:MAG: hypothetical protein BIFFINMI_02673 [Phycisphaerae bacterium]|nr:hypothetical protein [Phycisphaerae bacterium]
MSVSRIHRLLRLITLLRSGQGPNVTELADTLGISRRTVFRDLNMLELAGIPYYFDEQTYGYRIAPTFFLPPVNLTLEEALALMALIGQTGQLPLSDLAREAGAKIQSILPRSIQGELAKALPTIHVAWPAQARHQTVPARFDEVQKAIVETRKVEIAYVSFFERGQIVTELSPYRLFYFQRAWYVIGHSSLHKTVRTFKLGRIRRLTPLGRLYVPDPDFSVEKHLGNAWGMIPEGHEYAVRLRFSPMVASNVAEVVWHRTQKVEFARDGSAEFTATVDGLSEISWWILGYGDQVEVLAPAALRKRVRDMAKAVVARNEGRAGEES